jgi:hypothetical protein
MYRYIYYRKKRKIFPFLKYIEFLIRGSGTTSWWLPACLYRVLIKWGVGHDWLIGKHKYVPLYLHTIWDVQY